MGYSVKSTVDRGATKSFINFPAAMWMEWNRKEGLNGY